MASLIKIGTRGSRLALWQAEWVKARIEEARPDLPVHLQIIKTKGDKIQDVPLAKVGGKGLFVKEIEEALLSGEIDIAVHSMKDMPADIPAGLCIGAIPQREDAADVLISKENRRFIDLPQGAVVGTSSLRRASQLRHARKDIVIRSLRGNLDTRIGKLDTEEMDAIVVAAAGVHRLGFKDRITEYLDQTLMLPAVGQGALCIEIRQGDTFVSELMKPLSDPDTRKTVLGERAFLNRLGGGCQVPIAGYGRIENGMLFLTGLVASADGTVMIKESLSGPAHEPEKVGKALADLLADQGALKIIETLKESTQI